MKISGVARLVPYRKNTVIIFLILLLFSIGFPVSSALCSAAEGSPGGGWTSTDWFRVMNFAVLVVVLVFLLRKPLSQALGTRIEGIRNQLQDLEARKAEAEKQLARYNEKLSRLEQESEKIVEDYIRQGNEAKARILKEAASAAEKLQSQARRNIEHEFQEAKLKLQQEILEKSLVRSEEIIKGRISGEDQDRLVDEYLKKVEAG